jgi:hypothetical protein
MLNYLPNIQPNELPPDTEALCIGGPLSDQEYTGQALKLMLFDGGHYKRDPALIHVYPNGKSLPCYRWVKSKTLLSLFIAAVFSIQPSLAHVLSGSYVCTNNPPRM